METPEEIEGMAHVPGHGYIPSPDAYKSGPPQFGWAYADYQGKAHVRANANVPPQISEDGCRTWRDLEEMPDKIAIEETVAFMRRICGAFLAMRRAQKDYFKNRTQENLIQAKELETTVDKLLSDWRQ